MKTYKSYAKINLFLDVIRLYQNNYHGLRSLFIQTDLHDEIRWEKNSSGKIRVIDPENKIPEDNLLTRAAEKLITLTKPAKYGLDFHLKKMIPIGGGMGGGSSNAAGVLKILNREWGLRLGHRKLEWIGSKIGSDVPYFIRGGLQKVFGTGQILSPVYTAFFEIPAVIIVPDEKMETPKAYRLIDENGLCRDSYHSSLEFRRLLRGFRRQSVTNISSHIYNLFEKVVFPEIPKLTEIQKTLIQCGAVKAFMSGSGSTMVGIFERQMQADSAAEQLKKHYTIYPIRFIF